jgi:hypothetical protein
MKKVSFEQLGLVNLSTEEFQEINGGGVIDKLLKKVAWYEVLTDIKDSWDECKKGLKDGWNSLK